MTKGIAAGYLKRYTILPTASFLLLEFLRCSTFTRKRSILC